jgi:hypothetical protein
VHAEHGDTAGHVLASAIRAEPTKFIANQIRKLSPIALGILSDHLNDSFDFLGGEKTSAVAHR